MENIDLRSSKFIHKKLEFEKVEEVSEFSVTTEEDKIEEVNPFLEQLRLKHHGHIFGYIGSKMVKKPKVTEIIKPRPQPGILQ